MNKIFIVMAFVLSFGVAGCDGDLTVSNVSSSNPPGSAPVSEPTNVITIDSTVNRYHDDKSGVTCWYITRVHGGTAISCLPDVALKDDPNAVH